MTSLLARSQRLALRSSPVRLASLAFLLVLAPAVHAQLYFDVNNNTAGAGISNGTTYDWNGSNTYFTATAAGNAGITTWSGNQVIFSAGTDTTSGTSFTARLRTGVTLSSITTDTNEGNVTLSQGTGGSLTFGATTSLLVNSGSSLTISANAAGTNVAVTKTGAGTLTLSGTATYTGTTTVSAGTIAIGNNAAFGTSTLILGGGNLSLSADRTLSNALTINSNATVSATNGTDLLFSSNSVTTAAGATLTVDNSSNAGTASVGFSGSGFNFVSGVNLSDAFSQLRFSNASGTQQFSGVISGSGQVTRNTGAGTTALTNDSNSYTGTTTVAAGVLEFSSIANVNGGNSALGAPTNTTNGTIALGAATLRYTGSGHSTNRVLNLTADGATIDASGPGRLTFNNSGNAVTGSGMNLVLTGTGSGAITGGIATSAATLTKSGTGIWSLSGANNFTGVTTVSAGTLEFSSIANVSAGNSALGAPTTAANGTIALGAATLRYTGSGHSTNRVINLTASGAAIEASGSGTLTLDTPGSAITGANRSFTLGGTGNGVIADAIATGTGSLTKSGTGTWTLSGASTYTGATNLAGGSLFLESANVGTVLASTVLNQNDTSLLRFSGTSNSTSRAKSFTTTNLVAGHGSYVVHDLTTSGSTTLGLGDLVRSAGATADFKATSGTLGTDALITTSEALSNGILGGWATVGGVDFATKSGSNLVAYSSYTTPTGSAAKIVSSGSTNVRIDSTSTGIVTANTDGTTDINTLKIGDLTARTVQIGTTTGPTNILRLGAAGGVISTGAAHTLGNGIDFLTAGGAANTAGEITFHTDSALNVSSIIANNGSGVVTVSKAGADTLTLSGNNTYSGATYVNLGTLKLGAAGNATNTPLGTTAAGTTVRTGAALDVNGFTLGTAEALTLNGSGISSAGALLNSSAIAASYSGGITLGSATSIGGTGNLTLTGVMGGTGSLTKVGANTLTLNGANTYTGATTISSGTVQVNTLANAGVASSLGAATGANAIINLGAGTTLRYTGSGHSTNRVINLTGAATIESAGAGTLTLNAASGPSITSLNQNLILAGTGNGLVADAISLGTGGVTKTGTGTWTFSGQNNYSGATTIAQGTLALDATSATSVLPSQSTLVFNGSGTLQFTGNSTVARTQAVNGLTLTKGAGAIILNDPGTASTTLSLGAITRSSGGGVVDFRTSGGTLGTDALISTTTANDASGILGAFATVNNGADWAARNGSNQIVAYSGYTTLAGANPAIANSANSNVRINNSSTGTATLAASTTTINTLAITDATSRTVNVDLAPGDILRLGGTTGTGGILTSGGSHTIGVAGTAGTLTAGSGVNTAGEIIAQATSGLTINSAIANNGSGVVAFTKAGTGTVTFNGTNTYTGTTNIHGGTLQVGAGGTTGTLGTGSVLNEGTLAFNRSNALSFSNTLSGAGTLRQAGTGVLTVSGTNTNFSGAVAVDAGTLKIGSSSALGSASTAGTTVATGAALDISGFTLSNGNLSLAGSGVSNSGALFSTSGASGWLSDITLLGSTTIRNTGSTMTLGPTWADYDQGGHTVPTDNGFITLGTSSNTLTFTGTGNIEVRSRIRDFDGQAVFNTPTAANAGNVEVNMSTGTATVEFSANANTYTGTTTVKNGTLLINTVGNDVAPHDPVTDSVHAINGPLVIGDGDTTVAARVELSGSTTSETLAIGTQIEIKKDGTFDLNSNIQTIDKLTLRGGAVTMETNGKLHLNADVSSWASDTPATISGGSLVMTLHRDARVDTGPDATRKFYVESYGSHSADLTISSVVQAGDFVKATGDGVTNPSGNGTLLLTNLNTYTGFTRVENGILAVSQGTSAGKSALGVGGGTNTAQGTEVLSGGTLQLRSGTGAITSEMLTLNGLGAGSIGALNNLSGNNSWGTIGSAYINLASASRINSTADLLTLNTHITATSNANLTFGGAGNTTVNGFINTGTGTLTKDGLGTLILAGDKSLSGSGYSGATTISAGIVQVRHNDALGALTNGTTVADGAQLQLSNADAVNANVANLNIGGEALALNGLGYHNGTTNDGTGALRNVAGTNQFAGRITIGDGGTSPTTTKIQADTGTELQLDGGAFGGIVSSNPSNRVHGLNITTVGTGAITQNGAIDIGTITTGSAVVGDRAAGITNTGTSGSLTKEGAGTFTLSGGADSKVDAINLNAGTLAIEGSGTFVQSGPVNTLLGTTLRIDSATVFDASDVITTQGGVEMFVADGQTATIAGTLSGSGTLKKDGLGTLAFTTPDATADHSYSIGSLILNGGTLSLLGGVHLNVTGTLYITGDTTLDFGGLANTWLTSANLVIAPGVSITVTNWFSDYLSPSGSTTWSVTNNTDGIRTLGNSNGLDLTFGGSDRVGNSPLNQIQFNNWGSHNYNGLTTTWVAAPNHNGWFGNEIRPTPEPSTYGAIFLSGCVGLFVWRRHSKRRKAPQN